MRKYLPITIAGGLVVVGSLALSSVAFGAFGSGTSNPGNSVGAATVNPVTDVTVTPQSATSIHVTWKDPMSQLPGVEYKVVNNTQSTTPCSGLDSSTDVCDDTDVYPGQSYSYSVVAYVPSSNWTSSPSPVAANTPDVFGFNTVGTQTAGTSFNVTLTAKKATSPTNSTLVTDTSYNYASGRNITFDGLVASPNGTKPSYDGATGATSISVTTAVNFTSGVSSAVPVIAYAATPSASIAASDPTSPVAVAGVSGSFGINSGSLNSFSVSNPGTQIAGNQFSDTISALDTWGNPASGWTSTSACVSFSGPSSSPSPINQAPTYPAAGTCASGKSSLSFNSSGQASASITLYDAESPSLSVTSVSAPAAKTGTSTSFTVSPGSMAGIDITGVTTAPSPAITATGSIGSTLAYSSTTEANTTGNVLTASIQLVDQFGNAYTLPTGSTSLGIDLSVPTTGAAKDGTVSPSGSSALSVTAGNSKTGSTFTLTRNSGSGKTVTMTATVHGTTEKFTVTLSS